jgi:uncharacterized protein
MRKIVLYDSLNKYCELKYRPETDLKKTENSYRREQMTDTWDDRKKAMEEEYFRRKEQEAVEKLRAELQVEKKQDESLASALSCPKCDGTLSEVLFEEIKIDKCDKCNGIWLDAGELEQITKSETGWFNRFWKR